MSPLRFLEILFVSISLTAQSVNGREMATILEPLALKNVGMQEERGFYPTEMDLKALVDALVHGNVERAACVPCAEAVRLILGVGRSRQPSEDLMRLIKAGCVMFRVASARVCIGMVDDMKRDVVEIAERAAGISAEDICAVMLGSTCGYPASPAHNWTLMLREPPIERLHPYREPRTQSGTLSVLHMTDTHHDPRYVEGSNGNCPDPLCCEPESGPPRASWEAAGKWGYGPKCDMPLRTIESFLVDVKRTHKVDYVFWTGDLAPHRPWSITKEGIINILRVTANLVRKHLPGVPVYPALGNHEGIPQDFFPPPEVKGDLSVAWLYDALAEVWGQWLDERARQTVQYGGFYAAQIRPGLRIVSLNTNYCYRANWWLAVRSADPGRQLQWLVRELELAEMTSQKVHIIGHISPASDECLRAWGDAYLRIVSRFASTVAAQFFGHSHADEFLVSYRSSNLEHPSGVAYVAPSVTTYDSGHPSYRIYRVDGGPRHASWVVLDHVTYILNLTKARGLPDGREPSWELEYSARAAYGMEDLSPASWNSFLQRFCYDDDVFQMFYRHYRQLGPNETPRCTVDCKRRLLQRLVPRSHRSHLSGCNL